MATPPPGLVVRIYKRWFGKHEFVAETPVNKAARIKDVNEAPPPYSAGLLLYYSHKYFNLKSGLSPVRYSRPLFVLVPLHIGHYCRRGQLLSLCPTAAWASFSAFIVCAQYGLRHSDQPAGFPLFPSVRLFNCSRLHWLCLTS